MPGKNHSWKILEELCSAAQDYAFRGSYPPETRLTFEARFKFAKQKVEDELKRNQTKIKALQDELKLERTKTK